MLEVSILRNEIVDLIGEKNMDRINKDLFVFVDKIPVFNMCLIGDWSYRITILELGLPAVKPLVCSSWCFSETDRLPCHYLDTEIVNGKKFFHVMLSDGRKTYARPDTIKEMEYVCG